MIKDKKLLKTVSWISEKTTKGKPSKIHGLGFFAVEDICKGEIVAIKGGHLIDKDTLHKNRKTIANSQMQIDDNQYIAPLTKEELEESMIYVNHNCNPNLYIRDKYKFIALRDVKAGEELTFDYGTGFADEMKFSCNCNSAECRKVITGNDYKDKKLQEKYEDKFSWFIFQKIKQKDNEKTHSYPN